MATDFDILIIGGGPAGLCLAAALAPGGLRVAVVDEGPLGKLREPAYDGREIAMTHTSVELLQELQIWERIAQEDISELRDARVLNGDSPAWLKIDHRDGTHPQLGFLVSNHHIRRAAYERVSTVPEVTLMTERRVSGIVPGESSIRVLLGGEESCSARLVVAADSRFSQSRRAMGIGARHRDFGKTMLVCRAAHSVPHEHIAVEWFDYGYTMALLPLNGNVSSVLLTVPHHKATMLQQMPEAEFNAWIEERYRRRMGSMQVQSERFLYPLVGVYPDRLVASRFALIGDAAVGMHPVTAHGFNLGLVGVNTLSHHVLEAARGGEDIGVPRLLARYESAHQRATRPLYLATNAIVSLFTNDAPPVRLLREAVLRASGQFAPFRKILARALTRTLPGGLPGI